MLKIRNKTLRAIARYSSQRKLANFARAMSERRNKVLTPRSIPYRANIDVTNACNLHCTFCPTGQKHYGRKVEMISLDRIEKLLDEVGDYLLIVHLYLWGEPLLHPHIGKIVSMIHQRRIFTEISTNLNIAKKSQLEAVCDSQLDHLIMSIDGATQKVYGDYRKSGDLEAVLENAAFLVDYKRRHKLRYPTLEWRFLKFNHNLHELTAAREMAKKIGVDIFTADDAIDCENINERAAEAIYQSQLGQPTCKSLYNLIVLNPDGGVSPCCTMIDKKDDFGEPGGRIRDIWTNERYTLARKLFVPELLHELPVDMSHPCLHCPVVQVRPHLNEYLRNNPNVDFDGKLKTANAEMAIRSPGEGYSRSSFDESGELLRRLDSAVASSTCDQESHAKRP